MLTNNGQTRTVRDIDAYNGILPLIFPIAGDSYRLRDNWHVKRGAKRCSADHSFNEERRAHNGVDIGSKLGIPVYSCADGEVIPPPYDDFPIDRYGNCVWVQSASNDISFGYRFLYSHLDEIHVQTGQKIDTATQIGTIGMTGNALRPHLHFEIHYPSENKFDCTQCKPNTCRVTAINPYPSLSKAKSRLRKEADLAAEKLNVTWTTVRRIVKSVVDKPSILWVRD